jgi:hypothetical protein
MVVGASGAIKSEAMAGAEWRGRTCGEVLSERTISSSGMRCAGLKKWAPMMRSAACKDGAQVQCTTLQHIYRGDLYCQPAVSGW